MANASEGQRRKKNAEEWMNVQSVQFEQKSQNNTEIELDAGVEVGSDDNHVPCYQENDNRGTCACSLQKLKTICIPHTSCTLT
jgi:hypothetical protein